MTRDYRSPTVGTHSLIDAVTQCVSLSLHEYFSRPPALSAAPQAARVEAPPGGLALRAAPASDAPALSVAPDGARLAVRARYADWCAVERDGVAGYVPADSIVLLF